MNKRARWTILNVEEAIIKVVKKYAALNGLRAEKALSDLIANSPKARKLYQEEIESQDEKEIEDKIRKVYKS